MRKQSAKVLRWQAKQRSLGNCICCGKPRGDRASVCAACQQRHRPRHNTESLRSYHRMKKKRGWLTRRRKLHNSYMQKWRPRIRAELLAAYGGKCACCGEAQQEFLGVDHIDRDGAQERRRYSVVRGGGAGFYSWLKSQGWPKERYQLLCMNCNFARRSGICPHKRRSSGGADA